jgi:hypothetical protein
MGELMVDYTVPVWLLDLVIFIFLMEWAYLNFRFKRTQQGPNFLALNFAMAPGFFLILAFRFTADESISIFSIACLFISGLLHLVDFYLRHRAAKTKQ